MFNLIGFLVWQTIAGVCLLVGSGNDLVLAFWGSLIIANIYLAKGFKTK